jgi:hypothetical protein
MSSEIVLGKLDVHIQNNESRLVSLTIYKNQIKWINDLKIKPQTLKLLEENIGEMVYDIFLCKVFLTRP